MAIATYGDVADWRRNMWASGAYKDESMCKGPWEPCK